jgi:hypothetical protein
MLTLQQMMAKNKKMKFEAVIYLILVAAPPHVVLGSSALVV